MRNLAAKKTYLEPELGEVISVEEERLGDNEDHEAGYQELHQKEAVK